jgi:hypothetical protein
MMLSIFMLDFAALPDLDPWHLKGPPPELFIDFLST